MREPLIANAKRQAHWQAHKTHNTEANLANESALFPRFCAQPLIRWPPTY